MTDLTTSGLPAARPVTCMANKLQIPPIDGLDVSFGRSSDRDAAYGEINLNFGPESIDDPGPTVDSGLTVPPLVTLPR